MTKDDHYKTPLKAVCPGRPPVSPENPMLMTREAWIMRRWSWEHKYMTAQVYMEFMCMTHTERTWFLLQI